MSDPSTLPAVSEEARRRLAKLFTADSPESGQSWQEGDPDYLERFSLSEDDIPVLVEVAFDRCEDCNTDDYWQAPVYALRALGQLRSEQVVGPLLGALGEFSLTDNDWAMEDASRVLHLIGPSCLPAVEAYVSDKSHDQYARTACVATLENFAASNPECRDRVVQLLISELERRDSSQAAVNGFVISSLLQLEAVEAAEVIERAYAEEVVEDIICGRWVDAREKLGVDGLGLAPDLDYFLYDHAGRKIFSPKKDADLLKRFSRIERAQLRREKVKRKKQKADRKRNRKAK